MSIIRNELELQKCQTVDQEQRANDLEQIMESVKSKIGELEDESLNRVCQQHNKIKDLQKEYAALQVLSYVVLFLHYDILILMFLEYPFKSSFNTEVLE